MSETAKEIILARIRGALANAPEAPETPQTFRARDEREQAAILADFVDRLVDYKAQVTQTPESRLAEAITVVCRQYEIKQLLIPADLPTTWLPAGVTIVPDDPPLAISELDKVTSVLTGCAIAIAQTGTIILDGGATQGRRALSLVPDLHLCVVRAQQVVGLVPEAVAAQAQRATRPITLISGPSATSDIELSRVEGVHGPRTLHIFVVDD